MSPPFEWDEAKRQRTLAERGVDFAAFGVFWDGRPFVEELDPRHTAEVRYLRYARLDGGRLAIVVWTPRDGAVRVISARKANPREQRRYGPRIPPLWRVGEPPRIPRFGAMDEIPPYDPATFDWTKFDATTDEDIARQIAEDPDTAPELTDAMMLDAWIVVDGVRRSFAEVMREAGTPLAGDPLAAPSAARTAGEG